MHSGRNLVFVTGCGRSGTTYLQRLLASHPQVKTGPESHLFSLYIDPLLKAWDYQVKVATRDTRSGSGLPCYMDDAQYINTLKGFLFELLKQMVNNIERDRIFVEKSPSHVNSISSIHELLPKAQIIHIIRDPRDVVASILAASRSWGKNWAVDNAKIAAHTWCKHINNVIKASKKLDKSNFFEIRYETLVANPAQSLVNIGNFIGLSWSESDLEEAVYNNSLEVARQTGGTEIPIGGLVAKSRGNILKEPEGFVRKGKPGSWKTDLTMIEKLTVWLIARSMMEKLGYRWQFPW